MNTQENEKNIREIWALFRETDRKIKAMSEESERNRNEDREELRERFKETDRVKNSENASKKRTGSSGRQIRR